MSNAPDDGPSLNRDDAEFVSRIAEAYAPAELAPARRAELDAALRARVEAVPRFRGRPASGFAAAAAGAFVLLTCFVLGPAGRGPDRLANSVRVAEAATPTAAAWERSLLAPVWSGDPQGYDESRELPEDYVAIAGVFLDY